MNFSETDTFFRFQLLISFEIGFGFAKNQRFSHPNVKCQIKKKKKSWPRLIIFGHQKLNEIFYFLLFFQLLFRISRWLLYWCLAFWFQFLYKRFGQGVSTHTQTHNMKQSNQTKRTNKYRAKHTKNLYTF